MTKLIDKIVEMFFAEEVPTISECPNCCPDTEAHLEHEECYCTTCGIVVLGKKQGEIGFFKLIKDYKLLLLLRLLSILEALLLPVESAILTFFLSLVILRHYKSSPDIV